MKAEFVENSKLYLCDVIFYVNELESYILTIFFITTFVMKKTEKEAWRWITQSNIL